MTGTKQEMAAAVVGSVVRYEDRANPGTTYVVVEVNDNPWSTYKLRNTETHELEYTDGRQAGWTLVADATHTAGELTDAAEQVARQLIAEGWNPEQATKAAAVAAITKAAAR